MKRISNQNTKIHSIKKSMLLLCLAAACLLSACGQNAAGEPAKRDSQAHSASAPSATLPIDTPDMDSFSPSTKESAADSPVAAGESAAGSPVPAGESAGAAASPASEGDTPVSLHGALTVQDTCLVDKNGEAFQLCGMSTHGLAWFPQYVNYDAFQTLRDDWNTNCVRLAMYTAEYGGYCTGGDREGLKATLQDGVEYAAELGMYVIIDWHILSEQDPNVYKQDALAFFQEMSSAYAGYDNVLYEICNEPNGYATWDSVKAYAEEVIPVIRANDSDAVILVGSPTWSQDIDKAAADPLGYDNIMYTLHFYAGTHKDDLRSRLETCIDSGLPVFISEFGICDASGNGANDFDSAQKWMELAEKHSLSFICWNLANKEESSSAIRSGCDRTAGWSDDDLSESGRWIREYFRSRQNTD